MSGDAEPTTGGDDEVRRWVCETCGHSFWVVCSNPDCEADQ